MDPFSLAAADEIFAAFPEWRALAREEQADDGTCFLVIEVKAPLEANVEHGLIVDTQNREVTVGFDCYHSHFDQWVGDGDHFGTQAALEFIKQVLNERVAVVSWWQDEKWCGSSQVEAGTSPQPPWWQTRFNRIRIRSWKGTLNADISAQPLHRADAKIGTPTIATSKDRDTRKD